MSTSSPIFALLSRAVDAAALRQAVYTANIANADVDGYRRLEVAFQPALGSASEVAPESQPRIVAAADPAVRLDHEMALMAKNAVDYQALLGAFERMTGLLQLAVRDGREG